MDEGMTMVFAVSDPALLKTVKAGDKIKFDADRVRKSQVSVTTRGWRHLAAIPWLTAI